MKVGFIIFSTGLWLLTSVFHSVAANYGWPLGREAAVTGTFGEYREGHFHTGIDFSTGGEIGRPVFAVAEGEVYRVADSLTGFGKAVYLSHPDGNSSVYAHLDRFAGEIQKWVDRKRRGMKFRDKLDATLDPHELPRIKKGELIGTSGESGDGLPHLHFELRRNEETPIHPFDFLPNPGDHTPPRMLAVTYTPAISRRQDMTSDWMPLEEGKRIWPPDPGCVPTLTGRVSIYLTVTDTSDAAPGYTLSPRRISYCIDRHDTKTIAFDCLSYAQQENKKVGLIYDLAPADPPGSYRFRLYSSIPRPKNLSADSVSPLDAARMAADTHWLGIRAEDIAGNFSEVEIPFVTAAADEKSRPLQSARLRQSQSILFYPNGGKPEKLVSTDGRVFCILSPDMFYSAEVVALSVRSADDFPFDTTPPRDSISPLDLIYPFTPAGIPLASAATIGFMCPKSARIPPEKWGIYRSKSPPSAPSRWAFVGSMLDTESRTIFARIDRLAAYALFDDSVPPRITLPDRITFARDDEIHVEVSDGGSGIADSGSVLVDGKPHEEWYYDADRGWLRILARRLARGPHRLAVTMADRIGNVSGKEWAFRIQ